MSYDLLVKCLSDIREFSQVLQEVVPSNYGETFLHPDWHRCLTQIAASLPYTRMVVPTNGTLLNEAAINKLAQVRTLMLVNFSVNAALPATYEAFHYLLASNMAKIEQAVVRLKQARPDVLVWISMVQDCEWQSPREVELFRERWSKYGVVQINSVQYSGRLGRRPHVPVSLPCRSLFSDMVVLWDGSATSCCFDSDGVIAVGDARRETLSDIWHGIKFAEVRALHNAGKRAEIPICASCTFA